MPSSHTQTPKLDLPERSPALERDGGLTGEIDPTREIRTLIDQLQSTARDSRSQLREVEQERDALAAQLRGAQREADEARAQLEQLEALTRERDIAVRDAERQRALAAEAQGQLAATQRERGEFQRQRDDAIRQRDEIVRQRDDAISRRDEAARQREELAQRLNDAVKVGQDAGSRFGELQKQLLSIRQARDTALAQKLEISKKLAETQEQLEQAQYDLQNAPAPPAGPTPETEQQISTLTAERDAVREQLAALTAERDAAREQLAAAQAERESGAETQAAALADAQREFTELRDQLAAARAREDALASELGQIRTELDGARERQEGAAEAAELREQLAASASRASELHAQLDGLARRTGELESQLEFCLRERDAARGARDEASDALKAAQAQVEKIIRDRDHLRQESAEHAQALETQLAALRVQVATLEEADSDGAAHNAKVRELAALLEAGEHERADLGARLERQRVETIDLAAQLHSAQEEIRTLTAALGEARLQAKTGGGGSGAGARTAAVRAAISAGPRHAQPILPAPPPKPSLILPAGGMDTLAAQDTINALRLHYHTFVKDQTDIAPLKQFHRCIRDLAESTRVAGLMAMHRVSTALTGLVHELYHYPEQITPSNLRTVCQTMDFLGTLLAWKNPETVRDPAGAVVYAVDDDAENGHCIALGMETAGLRTTCVSDPASALCELAATPCDLILLDVNLPGMNGFELCTEIRQFALHRSTPIIFLTGMTGSEHRVQSSLSGGNDFITKPFILCEVTVKALTLILKAQLHVA